MKNQKELKELDNIFDKNKPLVLGKYKPRSIFKRTQYLKFTKEEVKDNILISGSAGSGKSVLSFSLAAQAMKTGNGFIYANFLWSGHVEPQLEALAKYFGREADIIFLKFDDKEFNEININDIVNRNKILVITSAPMERMLEAEYEKTLKQFSNLLFKIETPNNSYLPYMIFVDGWYTRKENDFNHVKNQIIRLNGLGIGFVAICQGLPFVKFDLDILEIFKSMLMLKLEDVGAVQEYLVLNGINIRDLVSQNTGEFHIFKNKKGVKYGRYKSFMI